MLDPLNPPQRSAVEHDEGPLLILAGAGSGKTRVITSRIAHLIAERDVAPDEIVAVTFTNKAADEMQERVGELLSRAERGPEASRAVISTFHSLGARLLRWHGSMLGLDRNFTILDQDDQLSLVREVAERLGLEIDHSERKRLRRYIERMKNRGHAPRGAHEETSDRLEEEDADFYEAYQRELREANAVDFGDLLLAPLELFRDDRDLAESYSLQWRYVMVDEFQDTNPAQYELLRHLTASHRNLTVVGDDDQSIYRWRDATVANILDFEEDFPETEVVKLEQNYRSTELILEAANDVIQKNPERREKKLWTDRGRGEEVTVFTAESAREEAEYVADEIQSHVRDGAAYDDFAIFYRTNAQGRNFEEQFRAAGIPYRVVGGVSFYGREEIKDVLAYLQLALNPEDDVSLLRIVSKPRRGVGEKTVEKLRHAAEVSGVGGLLAAARVAAGRTEQIAAGLSRIDPRPRSPADHEAIDTIESLGGRPVGGLREFVDLIADLREGLAEERPLRKLVRDLVDRVNYFEWLEDKDPERAEDKKRNVVELMEAMEEFEEELDEEEAEPPVGEGDAGGDIVADSRGGGRLTRFLERSALVRDAGSEETDGVATLMTVHGAKGLEFDTVFLTGLEEELFPNVRDDDPEELHEERRLAYVAITRAENHLYATNARRRRIYGQTRRTRPSRYLLDIDEERLELDPRSCVDAIEYGTRTNAWRGGRRGGSRTSGSDGWAGDADEWYFDQSAEEQIGELGSAVAGAAESGADEPDYFSQVAPEHQEEEAARPGAETDHALVGETVTHSRFGIGEVVAISGEGEEARLTIRFPGEGERTILRKFVQVMG